MDKYKICPSCLTKNEPTRFECVSCETDLTRIKITDEATENMKVVNEEIKAESNPMVRVCECGEKNPPNARKCRACNEDISDIILTPDTGDVQKNDNIRFVLSSLDGQYAYKISADETVIGKENIMKEYLAPKIYVSRIQARLTVENCKLYIENLSHTNGTFVNNRKITEKVELRDGDEIGLGGTNIGGNSQSGAAYFLVRIGQCM